MNKHSHRLVFSRKLGFCVAVAETVAAAGKSASGERRTGAPGRAAIGIALAAASLAAHAQGMPGGGAALTGVAPRPNLAAAPALPTGGTVVKGSGSISVNGANMTVNQASQRLVADWQSFSIGAGNSVRFVQPSSSAVALNRVTGNDPSNIFGALIANGHVYLENANGVYFAPAAQVSVGSLLATSLIIDQDQFMQGSLRLSGGSTSSGSVSNAGTIVAAPGGSVILAAPVVSNSGSITTPGGTTALVAGNAVNVDPTGSGLLSISVPAAAVNAQLAQSGTITADGGAVQLAAAAADAAVRTVMQVGGVVRARSIEQRDGQILLSGGASGIVMVDGQLDVSGGAAAQGGTVKVLGDKVGLTGAAHIDASGGTGGGTILVGGNRHGEGVEQNASDTFVGSGVVLDASATGQGDGGKVVVWADHDTSYAGQINARGGARGGDGGQAEVSGKQTLNFLGGSDLSASRGKTGTLLLDPTSITVGTVADRNGDSVFGDDVDSTGITETQFGAAASQIKATTVASLLATNSLSLAAGSTITIAAPVTVAAGGSATTLTLSAGTIAVNSPMTLNNASLSTSSGSITLDAAVSSSNAISLTSNFININAPLSAATMSMLNNTTDARKVAQTAGGTVNAGSLTLTGAAGNPIWDDVDLSHADNKIGTLNINSFGAEVRVANSPGVPLVVSGTVPDVFSLNAVNTSITQPGGALGALTIGAAEGSFLPTTTGSGDITLTNPANSLGFTNFTAAGNVNIASSGSFSASGNATGNVTLAALGGIFFLEDTIGGANVDVTGAGFKNFASTGAFNVPAGGRVTIHSSDYTQDSFGTLGFGVAAGSVNNIVYGGYTGVAPTTGNTLFTNQTGSIAPPNADNPPISKVYDGATGFTYTQTGTAAAGSLNTASLPTPLALAGYSVSGNGNFADKNAGANKGLTVGPSNNTQAVATSFNGATVYGLQFAGYTRAPGPHAAGTPGNAVSQITPKAITAGGIDGVDRIYNGTATVALNTAGASLTGVIAGDTVGLNATGATGTMANKNVGANKAVTVTGLALSGGDAGNYTVSDAGGANATISQLAITSHGLAGVDRTYNGTTTVAVNSSGGSLTGVIGGDNVTLAAGGTTGTMADKNVGTGKAVTIGGVALGGTDAGNYTVADASGAIVSITPLGITSTGIDGVDRIYNGSATVALNTAAASLAGVIAGDTVGLNATGATGTMANKNVGANKAVTVAGLALSGGDAGNYTVSDTSGATATISQLAIASHGLTGVDRTYNGTTTVAVNSSGGSLTGVIGGDNVTLAAGGTTGTMADKNVGTGKAVTIGGVALGGTDAGNYTVADASGAIVSITPLGITSTGITGVDRTYDGTTVVALNTGAAALNGTIAGDNISLVSSGATGSIADKNVGVAKPVTIGGLALGGGDAGNYTLTDASSATATITALAVQATGITAVNRADDGTTTVGLNTGGAGVTGILPGDTVGVDASGAVGSVATPGPGEAKPVTVTGVLLTGPDAIDYSVSPTPIGPLGGPLTVRILSVAQSDFDDLRFKQYLQAVADAQEPFRRAMLEALLSGFGKENIRKQLQRGLVFETGLAPPAVDIIEPAKAPEPCTPAGTDLSCGH